ncbi:MAG: co-chaperone GroES [Planctomycetes bacterium]|nr:co-chaperone GroES [Planctomycetota bacterium]
MAKFKPLDDRIVVEVLEAEERTAGGILLPDAAKEKPQRGTVTAVGPGKLLKSGARADVTVKKGDVVLFGKYAGTDVSVGGQEFKILKEGEVLARLD